MANQQLFPQPCTYPLTGDIQSAPGDPATTVVAIQSIPVSKTFPSEKQVLTSISGVWTPAGNVINNTSIEVNGTTVSDDYDVSVNAVLGIANSPLFVNGA